MLEGDFHTFCLADAAFDAAVGSRLYALVAPPKVASPYGVFRMISNVPLGDHETTGAVITRARFQVDLYGGGNAVAVTARDALIAHANGFSGVVGSTDFQEIWIENISGGYEENLKLFRYSCDLLMTHQAAS